MEGGGEGRGRRKGRGGGKGRGGVTCGYNALKAEVMHATKPLCPPLPPPHHTTLSHTGGLDSILSELDIACFTVTNHCVK